MNIIEKVRHEREDLARVLQKHVGIRKIVEDLYPDRAHFIYELLQNAEDAGATETKFTLSNQGLTFEHNGRPFEPQDIYAITDIGEGTKASDNDKIGRFGIGFKAVFAYTETPRIWSQTFSFQISELVLPEEISSKPKLGKITCFEFPFNNPKKPVQDAYAEVEAGLNELSETTLLFLSHIESIAWELDGKSTGEVLRIQHSTHHVEVLKQIGGKNTSSSHYLRFTKPVEGLEKQQIAVAFALDILPKVKRYNPKKSLADQFRIVPASHGQVAVFFPAEKETSGLHFHLHAPFVPELSRASIKETPANGPLFQQLAALAANSLHVIRDLKLLRGDFLAALPNPKDNIPDRYVGIRNAIVAEMNTQPLTPTNSGSHAPAKHLLQAKASLKKLLSLEDLKFLVDYNDEPPRWAIGATQKNSDIDRFLSGLAISEWDVDRFVEYLEENASVYEYHWDEDADDEYEGPNRQYIKWFRAKSMEWVQRFYALLYRELEPVNELDRLEDLSIVRQSNGRCGIGRECYFPTDDIEHDDVLPRVAKAVYTSGKNKKEQEKAKQLLEEIGVREVGEAEQVAVILKQRYRKDALNPEIKDIHRFIELVEKEPGRSRIFNNYFIFECKDGSWRCPREVYLDEPYLDTGLNAYYDALEGGANRFALSGSYIKAGLSVDKIAKFAEAVGVQCVLNIIKKSTSSSHPMSNSLHKDYWKRWTNTQINSDWQIEGIGRLLEKPTEGLSRLIWKTLTNADNRVLKAKFRPNQRYPTRIEPSTLIIELQQSAWIPQGNERFVKPANAVRDLLPKGFPFDPGWEWLQAIHFGEEIAKQTEEHRRKREVAKDLGFDDEESLDDAKWFAQLDPDDRKRFKTQYEETQRTELSDHEPTNPERRSTRIKEQAGDAPDRRTEQRTRSVSVSREAVKKDTDPYLRQQYTNTDGEMICQVCKNVLPFKLSDGSYFYEAVEFLPELKKRYYQNYIVLCPNHAAMYQHVNCSAELMEDMFLDLVGHDLEVVLADENTTIWFTKTHVNDLKAVIEADAADEEVEE